MQSDPVAESWRERNYKVIQNLSLQYPSAPQLGKLATLAQVNNPKAFGEHIKSIILDAHLNHAALHTLSMPEVRKALKSIKDRAQALADALARIDIVTEGSAQRTGMLLEWELNHPLPVAGLSLIPTYVADLETLSEAANRAAQRATSRPGPKGASGTPAFNPFIEALLIAAWQRGGKWKLYKSANRAWTGSLLEAVQLLRPYLPNRFFPAGELGRSIEHIRKQFEKYTHTT
jgi:hypothetical protein